jgi:hypothetical protein
VAEGETLSWLVCYISVLQAQQLTKVTAELKENKKEIERTKNELAACFESVRK